MEFQLVLLLLLFMWEEERPFNGGVLLLVLLPLLFLSLLLLCLPILSLGDELGILDRILVRRLRRVTTTRLLLYPIEELHQDNTTEKRKKMSLQSGRVRPPRITLGTGFGKMKKTKSKKHQQSGRVVLPILHHHHHHLRCRYHRSRRCCYYPSLKSFILLALASIAGAWLLLLLLMSFRGSYFLLFPASRLFPCSSRSRRHARENTTSCAFWNGNRFRRGVWSCLRISGPPLLVLLYLYTCTCTDSVLSDNDSIVQS